MAFKLSYRRLVDPGGIGRITMGHTELPLP